MKRAGNISIFALLIACSSAPGARAQGGPQPFWTAESDQVDAQFAQSVSRAGDVNGDGHGDVIVGAPRYDSAILNAGAVFYGRVPALVDVSKIKAELLLNYAGKDERINTDVPAFQKALDDAGVRYSLHTYDGVEHAFHNDTSAARYNPDAARLAWQRTVDFFKRTLKSA